ncbi:MAG: hypothetical protein HIU83_10785 [Proteobacteria bacterium]|nr:hypothetical protein [Pseudomonadota bacterium]
MKTKITSFLIPLLSGSATSAFAADGALQGGGGPLVWFFIGFGVLVIIMQLIPACIILYSMIKAIFSPSDTTARAGATPAAK